MSLTSDNNYVRTMCIIENTDDVIKTKVSTLLLVTMIGSSLCIIIWACHRSCI